MIRKTLASKKGSSSILVIMLMVVLVVFGIAALTTALSNMRLGQKAAEYTDSWYAAEATASERFADVDKAVSATNGSVKDVFNALAELDFDTQASMDDSNIIIAYETWHDDIGICTALCITDGKPDSLYVTEWIQTTKDN